ncbi:CPBP family glutamic-type intramembrane protease [Sinomonas sp. JGH33]|uniref:CPBP family glutamic-type intramembrane protease n=1 Tax=Sinomonas terricola TaxID=3110330 RepID=A0ABU5TBD7_9MICC|nr:CPBP family glutamic-type intramembrane protease [Sinomonas sp. JGH33]MEA5456999.1 CPBP family glutamic-type intramembrane protease [Sinomonas sp. JGH33]
MRLAWAFLGLVGAVACGWGVEMLSTTIASSPILEASAYLAVWIPLVAALILGLRGQRPREALTALGLRLRPLDLLWGIGIGCMGRAADAMLRLLAVGSTGASHAPTLSSVPASISPAAQTIVLGILAPVIVAPVLEELYFRGFLQRALAAAFARFGEVAKWSLAVVLCSLAFAAVHSLLLLANPAEALLTGAATLVFALAAGTTAAATGRLGGAVVGHVVFNGLGVLLTWPA